jgi:hypothetical protein
LFEMHFGVSGGTHGGTTAVQPANVKLVQRLSISVLPMAKPTVPAPDCETGIDSHAW